MLKDLEERLQTVQSSAARLDNKRARSGGDAPDVEMADVDLQSMISQAVAVELDKKSAADEEASTTTSSSSNGLSEAVIKKMVHD